MEQVRSLAIEPIAVRGERLSVHRSIGNDDGGNEVVTISVSEIDDSGRVTRTTHFDDGDEIAAIDLLDEWYVEGEGAADADVLRAGRELLHTYHAHDWTGLRDRLAPDFEFIDHRPLPWPLSDADGWVRLMQERIEQVPDLRSRIRKVWVQGRAALSVGEAVGTDEEGGLQRWPLLTVQVYDAAGKTRRIEYFAPEQFDGALARFDEIAAGPVDARHPWIENAATRIVPRATALYEAGRRDDTAALFAEGFRRIDRRTTVSFPDMGKAEYLEWHASAYEQFDTIRFQPLAVRGEHLCLLRVVMARDGFESVFGMLVQLDDEGLITEYVNFDEVDLAVAQDELDERFIAGEGAPYAPILRTARAFVVAMLAGDGDGVVSLMRPDMAFADHRRFGIEGGAAGFLPHYAEYGDIIQSVLVTKYVLAPNVLLATSLMGGVDDRGSEVVWPFHVVSAFDGDAQYRSSDFYDAEDWDSALVRFDELATPADDADPRHPHAGNAATRLNDRFVMLVEAGRIAEAGMVADDFVRVDRRSTVAAPDTSRPGDYADALAASLDVGFTSYRVTPIAVRGEQLALSRVVMTTDDGSDMRFLVFDETGDDGRAIRSVYFDDDDLVTAVEALEVRHRELSGDEYSEAEHAYVDKILAFNRAVGPVQCQVKRYVSPRAVISVMPIRGATAGRSDIVWQYVTVECFDRDGLVVADHSFQIEQWDEALALFDGWSADV
jgi:hypothetical protein